MSVFKDVFGAILAAGIALTIIIPVVFVSFKLTMKFIDYLESVL